MNKRIMVRSGGTVFDAAHSTYAGWEMLFNGRSEKIDGPTWWWSDGADVYDGDESLVREKFMAAAPVTHRGQLLLEFSDSKTRSRRAA